MANIKSFIVPPPDNPAINHPEIFDTLDFEKAYSPGIPIHDETIRDLQEAAVSDAVQLIKHFDPKLNEYQSALERQVKAIEQVAHEAQQQSQSAIKLSKAVKEISVSAENQAKNSLQTAESSKVLSKLAIGKASKADIKGWIAIGISLAALGVEIISNWNSILIFFQMFTI